MGGGEAMLDRGDAGSPRPNVAKLVLRDKGPSEPAWLDCRIAGEDGADMPRSDEMLDMALSR